MAPWSFPHLNHWARECQICTISFVVEMDGEALANYSISRDRRAMENAFGILVSKFRVLLGTMEQRAKVVSHYFYMCVPQYAEHTPGQSRQGTNPPNDVVDLRNEQVVYVPDDNYKNPLRKAKHQRHLLQDYFNHMGDIGWAGGQDLRCVNQIP